MKASTEQLNIFRKVIGRFEFQFVLVCFGLTFNHFIYEMLIAQENYDTGFFEYYLQCYD